MNKKYKVMYSLDRNIILCDEINLEESLLEDWKNDFEKSHSSYYDVKIIEIKEEE